MYAVLREQVCGVIVVPVILHGGKVEKLPLENFGTNGSLIVV